MTGPLLYTLVVMPAQGKMEIKLQSRPFGDCYTVGKNFLDSEMVGIFGNRDGNGTVTYHEQISREYNEARGREYGICLGQAKLLEKAVLAGFYIIED